MLIRPGGIGRVGLTAAGLVSIPPGIAAPTVTITGGTTDTPLQPELNTSAYDPVGGNLEAHASTDWQIATDSAFSNVVWSAPGSASLTQITVGMALEDNTTYYARARHNSASYTSDWSSGVEFTTINVFVTTPSITSPADGATDIGETPTLTSSAFAVTNGSDTHASTDWQIASDAGFTTIVHQSLDDASNLESWTTPALSTSTTYYVRVRHTGTNEGDSAWSAGVSFTTAASFGWAGISGFAYASKSKSVASEEPTPRGLFLKPDGTKMYVVGENDTIYPYTLSTADDISTATYDGAGFSTAAQVSSSLSLTTIKFKDDGTKFYVAVNSSAGTIYQYSMSTAWDVTSASYDSKSFSPGSVNTGVAFGNSGSDLYIIDFDGDKIDQYTLSTPWDISTATFSQSLDISANNTFGTEMVFSPSGELLFIVDRDSDDVKQYSLSVAWDISTASYDSVSVSVLSQENSPFALAFNDGGTKFYIAGSQNDTVYQYE